METSIFIAKIFGLSYLVLGIGFLFNRKAFQQVMEDYCKNAAVLFYGGLLALVVGIVIILTHNIWVSNWTVIITILGWIAFAKGIWIIVFPNRILKYLEAYQKNENMIKLQSILTLIFGAVLTYFGFFA